eukprot:1942141-Pyramimonas_sp.AAC.1
MREACWNRGPDCPPLAESRRPGKARKQGGPCKRPVCGNCSDVCPNCSNQWLREDCFQMEEHNCSYLLIQAMHDQARFVEAQNSARNRDPRSPEGRTGPTGSRRN